MNLLQLKHILKVENLVATKIKETELGDFLYETELPRNKAKIKFYVPHDKTFVGKMRERMQELEPAKYLIDFVVIKTIFENNNFKPNFKKRNK